MNTKQVLCKLDCLLKWRRTKYAVLPSDGLDHVILDDSVDVCLVVNTKPSSHGGEHWTAIYIPKNSTRVLCFCSYGRHLNFYGEYFRRFLSRTKRHVTCSNIRLQCFSSVVCG